MFRPRQCRRLPRLKKGSTWRQNKAKRKEKPPLSLNRLDKVPHRQTKAHPRDKRRIKEGSTRRKQAQCRGMEEVEERRSMLIKVKRQRREQRGVVLAAAVALVHQKVTKGRTGRLTNTITTTIITITTNIPLTLRSPLQLPPANPRSESSPKLCLSSPPCKLLPKHSSSLQVSPQQSIGNPLHSRDTRPNPSRPSSTKPLRDNLHPSPHM